MVCVVCARGHVWIVLKRGVTPACVYQCDASVVCRVTMVLGGVVTSASHLSGSAAVEGF